MIGRVSKEAFAKRRRKWVERAGAESVLVLPAAPERTRSRDVQYRYRPDSDLFYLSGFKEPEALLVLIPGREEGEYVLFCRESDPEKEVWDGRRAGIEGAKRAFCADEAYPISEVDERLPQLLENKKRLYYPVGRYASLDEQVLDWLNVVKQKVRKGVAAPDSLICSDTLLHEMRLYKDEEEQAVMKEVAEIAAQAHIRAMECCRPGLQEYQLEAEYLHEFLRYGCQYPAYPTIVGGGANGCILHYIDNCDELRSGDLVLVDAGGELEGYASDITRTFPVNGCFTEEQKLIYELVLAAQLAAIDQVKPGNRWNQPHDAAVKELTEGLVVLGLLEGEPEQLIKEEAYRKFYMHNTGHWLGLDVHDVGRYKVQGEWRQLQPGMVLTVEPGLYIASDCEDVGPKWRGIAVRIEDDVLVTVDGHEILTASVPKSVCDVEALMGERV